MVVVVVAEDGEDAVRRGERRSAPRRTGRRSAIAPGDVVAAEHDEIGSCRHQQSDSRVRRRRADTQRLRWTSVSRPMRSPASAGGSPLTGTSLA